MHCGRLGAAIDASSGMNWPTSTSVGSSWPMYPAPAAWFPASSRGLSCRPTATSANKWPAHPAALTAHAHQRDEIGQTTVVEALNCSLH